MLLATTNVSAGNKLREISVYTAMHHCKLHKVGCCRRCNAHFYPIFLKTFKELRNAALQLYIRLIKIRHKIRYITPQSLAVFVNAVVFVNESHGINESHRPHSPVILPRRTEPALSEKMHTQIFPQHIPYHK